MTITVLAADPERGELGAVITSSSPAVGARCVQVLAGVGAAASQNVTDPRLRGRLLEELTSAGDVTVAVDRVWEMAEHAEHRQLALIDASGNPAARSGAGALGVHGAVAGHGCVVVGNLLARQGVLDAARVAFELAAGPLAGRLLSALRAAVAAGGEAGPVRSAALVVACDPAWPVVDLRVDDHDDPVLELERLWSLYAPLAADYVTRAVDPATAPAFGVPGEAGDGVSR